MGVQEIETLDQADCEERRAEARAIAETCIRVLKERFGVREVYLFGSLVGEGPWHAGSDIDLAVEGLPPQDFWHAWEELERLVPSWLEVDLFPLERVYPEVRAHILREVEMPKDPHAALWRRMQDELRSLERVVTGAGEYLGRAPPEVPEIELRGLASYVEDFYSGCERLFERVAVYLDDGVPTGERWHEQLLQQMAAPGPRGRPPVIAPGLASRLDAYRRFRHRARHLYGFELEWPRVRELAAGMTSSFKELQQELASFGEWLQERAQSED